MEPDLVNRILPWLSLTSTLGTAVRTNIIHFSGGRNIIGFLNALEIHYAIQS